ncbi:hypothetical protein PTTG_29148 [Puccinia triticina 1-1 BBBD Race 1]|uniref:Uncharacterized protein n=1 Tax=Puccinia triticina (isolate 1-1 / race 1 (BBBD)) TaxID=630390 RepID=A0A180G680_PUCT1|nr:hypothetical protein PTTG_29148 [Puccinia triticina 1-1 BBBD Race 1]
MASTPSSDLTSLGSERSFSGSELTPLPTSSDNEAPSSSDSEVLQEKLAPKKPIRSKMTSQGKNHGSVSEKKRASTTVRRNPSRAVVKNHPTIVSSSVGSVSSSVGSVSSSVGSTHKLADSGAYWTVIYHLVVIGILVIGVPFIFLQFCEWAACSQDTTNDCTLGL